MLWKLKRPFITFKLINDAIKAQFYRRKKKSYHKASSFVHLPFFNFFIFFYFWCKKRSWKKRGEQDMGRRKKKTFSSAKRNFFFSFSSRARVWRQRNAFYFEASFIHTRARERDFPKTHTIAMALEEDTLVASTLLYTYI